MSYYGTASTPQEEELFKWLDDKSVGAIVFFLAATRPEIQTAVYARIKECHAPELAGTGELVIDHVNSTISD